MNEQHIPTPEEFASVLRSITEKYDDDVELSHCYMDDAIMELLRLLGYSEAADIFEDSPRWYA